MRNARPPQMISGMAGVIEARGLLAVLERVLEAVVVLVGDLTLVVRERVLDALDELLFEVLARILRVRSSPTTANRAAPAITPTASTLRPSSANFRIR